MFGAFSLSIVSRGLVVWGPMRCQFISEEYVTTSDPQWQPRKRHSAPTPPWVLEADTVLIWACCLGPGQVTWKAAGLRGMGSGQNKKGRQRMQWLDGIINSTDLSLSKLGRWWRIGKPGMLQSIGSQSWTQLSNNNQSLRRIWCLHCVLARMWESQSSQF